ncbi:MAG: hypothetical protein ACRCXC_05420 [Legionella sp.]
MKTEVIVKLFQVIPEFIETLDEAYLLSLEKKLYVIINHHR